MFILTKLFLEHSKILVVKSAIQSSFVLHVVLASKLWLRIDQQHAALTVHAVQQAMWSWTMQQFLMVGNDLKKYTAGPPFTTVPVSSIFSDYLAATHKLSKSATLRFF